MDRHGSLRALSKGYDQRYRKAHQVANCRVLGHSKNHMSVLFLWPREVSLSQHQACYKK